MTTCPNLTNWPSKTTLTLKQLKRTKIQLHPRNEGGPEKCARIVLVSLRAKMRSSRASPQTSNSTKDPLRWSQKLSGPQVWTIISPRLLKCSAITNDKNSKWTCLPNGTTHWPRVSLSPWSLIIRPKTTSNHCWTISSMRWSSHHNPQPKRKLN
jgi:hypothetical protein